MPIVPVAYVPETTFQVLPSFCLVAIMGTPVPCLQISPGKAQLRVARRKSAKKGTFYSRIK